MRQVLLAIKSMGGESEAAWRALLDDLVRRGLPRPELVVVDGAPGLEKALAALWPDMAVQRCSVHKHRNLLAHAPERLHEEISNDYKDMIYAKTKPEVEARRKAFVGALRREGDRGSRLAAAPSARAREPQGEQEHNRSDRGVDDEADDAGAEMNSEAMRKPVADELDPIRGTTGPWI